MNKLIVAIVVAFTFCGVYSYAATDVNEVALVAAVTQLSVTSSTAVDMSSGTLVASPVAYNICNEDTTINLRCGYSTSVSTIAANNYLGFKVKPGECEYRAASGINTKIYCKAAGATAVSVVRELFGR